MFSHRDRAEYAELHCHSGFSLLDGASTPVVNLAFEKYFDRTTAPFNYPFLVFQAGMGNNNYVPIPFSQSCRVEAGAGWGKYYHVTYSTFPATQQVSSFTATRTADETARPFGWR